MRTVSGTGCPVAGGAACAAVVAWGRVGDTCSCAAWAVSCVSQQRHAHRSCMHAARCTDPFGLASSGPSRCTEMLRLLGHKRIVAAVARLPCSVSVSHPPPRRCCRGARQVVGHVAQGVRPPPHRPEPRAPAVERRCPRVRLGFFLLSCRLFRKRAHCACASHITMHGLTRAQFIPQCYIPRSGHVTCHQVLRN